jgi:hypothetical protein
LLRKRSPAESMARVWNPFEMRDAASRLLGKEGLALLWKDAVEELTTPAVRTALSA